MTDQKRLEIPGRVLCVLERPFLGGVLQEIIEGAVGREIRHEIDAHLEVVRLLGHDDAGEVVPVRILLPVQEVAGGLDVEGVAMDRRPVVRRRPQADRLRPEQDGSLVAVAGSVVKGDADGQT